MNRIGNVVTLFPCLAAVVFFAEHLAVFGFGLATLMPEGDVVGLHLVYLEVLAADGTDPLLAFVGLAPLPRTEGMDI